MLHTIRTEEIGLLLLLHRLQVTQRPLGTETIIPFAEAKLPRVAKAYSDLVNSLMNKGLIEGDHKSFVLTPDGQKLVEQVSQAHSLDAWFYNEYYQAVLSSKAHSQFCERVYGKDLSQHGMADMEQIEEMLEELEIDRSMSVLDFGCGDGQISEYIADRTKATVLGTDIAKRAIDIAQERTKDKRERINFCWADIEKGQGDIPQGKFDRITAIDSLYFASDQEKTFNILYDYLKPDGRMAVFHICPPNIYAEETILGQLLEERKLSYCIWDISGENVQHWKKKKQVLLELENRFYEEGNEFLFKNRITECYGVESYHRYLFVVYAPS